MLLAKSHRKPWAAYGGFLIACGVCAAGTSGLFWGIEFFDVMAGLFFLSGLGVVCYALLDKYVINKELPAEPCLQLSRWSWSILGLGFLFVMLPMLQTACLEARWAAEDAGQVPEAGYREEPGQMLEARHQEAINLVLQESYSAINDTKTAAEMAERVRSVNLSACPSDFAGRNISYVHAWESMALVERRAAALAAEGESSEAMMEAFFRGLMGDPFGKAREGLQAEKQIKRDYEEALIKIKEAADGIEEAAIYYGVALQ